MKRNLLLCALFLIAPSLSMAQTPISGGRTFYFDPMGVTPGTCDNALPTCPWNDLQVGYDHLRANFRLVSGAIVFQLANGVYTKGIQAVGAVPGVPSPNQFVVRGDVVNPANVVIRPTGSSPSFVAAYGALLRIEGVKMDHVNTMQDMILIGQDGKVVLGKVEFGYNVNPYNHISVQLGGYLEVTTSYTISGSAQCHILMGDNASGYFVTNGQQGLIDVTLVGNPDFYAGFLFVRANSSLNAQAIGWTGSATGRKFVVEGNGTLDIGGTEACDVPGSQPGLLKTGGQLLSHPGDFVQ